MAYIDKIFRGYGEDFFGKKCMDQISDSQVEEARCFTFREMSNLTAKYGKIDNTDNKLAKELFCNYVFGTFI